MVRQSSVDWVGDTGCAHVTITNVQVYGSLLQVW